MKSNPATRTRYFERRSKKLLALLERYPGDAAEAVRERPFDLFLPPPDNENEPLPDNGHEPLPDAPPVQGGDEPSPTDRRNEYPPVEDRSIRSNSI